MSLTERPTLATTQKNSAATTTSITSNKAPQNNRPQVFNLYFDDGRFTCRSLIKRNNMSDNGDFNRKKDPASDNSSSSDSTSNSDDSTSPKTLEKENTGSQRQKAQTNSSESSDDESSEKSNE